MKSILLASLLATTAVLGQSVIPIDPFTAETPFQSIGEEQNLSLPVYDSSIRGGFRDLYIRNFSPDTELSYTIAVEDGALSYTTYTPANENSWLSILYGNLPEQQQLNLDLNTYKQNGFIRFALAQPAPDFRLRFELYEPSLGYFSATVSSLDSNYIDIPFTELSRSFDPESPDPASDYDLADVDYFSLEIKNQGLTAERRPLVINSISIYSEASDQNPEGGIISATANPPNSGAIDGAGASSGSLTALPALGYLFDGWAAPYDDQPNPLVFENSVSEDINVVANFIRDEADDDGDGLTNYQELAVYGSSKSNPNSDSDALNDGQDAALAQLGFDPLKDDTAKLDALFANVDLIHTLLSENYSESSLQDLQLGGVTITPDEDGQFQIRIRPQAYRAAEGWQDLNAVIEWTLEQSFDEKRIIRFRPITTAD